MLICRMCTLIYILQILYMIWHYYQMVVGDGARSPAAQEGLLDNMVSPATWRCRNVQRSIHCFPLNSTYIMYIYISSYVCQGISMYCISMYMYVYPFVPCAFHWFLFYSHVICGVSRLFCHQLLFYSHWVLLHAPLILILSQIYFPVIPKQFLGCCLQLRVTGIAKKESERETS